MVAAECSGGGPRNKPQPLPVVRTFAPLPLQPWTGSKPSLGQKLDQASRTPAEQAAAAIAAQRNVSADKPSVSMATRRALGDL